MSGFQVSSGLIRREPVGNTGGKVRLDYRRFGVVGGKHVTALPEYNMASRTVKSLVCRSIPYLSWRRITAGLFPRALGSAR